MTLDDNINTHHVVTPVRIINILFQGQVESICLDFNQVKPRLQCGRHWLYNYGHRWPMVRHCLYSGAPFCLWNRNWWVHILLCSFIWLPEAAVADTFNRDLYTLIFTFYHWLCCSSWSDSSVFINMMIYNTKTQKDVGMVYETLHIKHL